MATPKFYEGQEFKNPTDPTAPILVYRGGKFIPKSEAAAERPKVTEFQAKAGAQATLMDQAIKDYRSARQTGYNPASIKNVLASRVEGDGEGPGSMIADWIRDNPSERGRASELAYTEGALRALTGAAATPGEVRTTSRNMFRQPGESDAVEGSKEAVRRRFFDQVRTGAGDGYIDPNAEGGEDNPFDLSQGQSRATIPRNAYYRDPMGNIRRNENGDKGNPIVKPAKAGAKAPAKSPTTAGFKILSVE